MKTKIALQALLGVVIVFILLMFLFPGKLDGIPGVKQLSDQASNIKMPALPSFDTEEPEEKIVKESDDELLGQESDVVDEVKEEEKTMVSAKKKDATPKKEESLMEISLDMNKDSLEDSASLVNEVGGLKLSVMVNKGSDLVETESKDLEIQENMPSLEKESFASGDTLVLVQKDKRSREKIKILYRQGKLIVGGFTAKSPDSSCDINFLNKRAAIDGEELRHTEKVSLLKDFEQNHGRELCALLKIAKQGPQPLAVEEKEEPVKEATPVVVVEPSKIEVVPSPESTPEGSIDPELNLDE